MAFSASLNNLEAPKGFSVFLRSISLKKTNNFHPHKGFSDNLTVKKLYFATIRRVQI